AISGDFGRQTETDDTDLSSTRIPGKQAVSACFPGSGEETSKERDTGVEPVSQPWEGWARPIYQSRGHRGYRSRPPAPFARVFTDSAQGACLMKRVVSLLPLLLVPSLFADETEKGAKLIVKPDAFQTLVNPQCSHCRDEAKRRAGELRDDDRVLCWTRG